MAVRTLILHPEVGLRLSDELMKENEARETRAHLIPFRRAKGGSVLVTLDPSPGGGTRVQEIVPWEEFSSSPVRAGVRSLVAF